MVACKNGNVDIVRLLVLRGAECRSTTPQGMTVTHLAAEAGNCDLIRLLLNVGVSVYLSSALAHFAPKTTRCVCPASG